MPVDTAGCELPKVLLVEDEVTALRFYADVLTAARLRVIEAVRGADALRQAFSARPSAILADLGLPDFDGFEVCRQVKLRPELAHVPVVAITGRAMALHDIELAEEAGFHSVLIKPVTAEVLVSAIMRALGKTSGPARQGPPGASARAL
jgi:two-component system, cell cycle response regulator DivK